MQKSIYIKLLIEDINNMFHIGPQDGGYIHDSYEVHGVEMVMFHMEMV